MQEPIDFVAFVVAVLAMIASKEVAALVGPYAAIMVLACSGAALGLSLSSEEFTARKAIFYVTLRVLLAVVLTIALAQALESVASWAKPKYTVAPLAFVIGYIRDYRAVFNWFAEVVKGLVGKKWLN